MAENPVVVIREEWEKSLAELQSGPFFRRLREGSLGLDHYKCLLREIYFNTLENPTSFALMLWHLQGKQRAISPKILRHCSTEYGHHELALRDLQSLGEDVSDIEHQRPLPTTEALIAFAVYHIQHKNPLTYLGYVYHLEMLPARSGGKVMEWLSAIGVPRQAMEFLVEHAHADVGHTQWVEGYFREAIQSQGDLEAVIHGVKGTCRLHGIMLQGILDAVDGRDHWTPAPSTASAKTS